MEEIADGFQETSPPLKKARKSTPKRRSSGALWEILRIDKNIAHKVPGLAGLPLESRENLVEFFLFVYERQCIWVRRKQNSEGPCTDDPILQSHFFCNNYRELDRGTSFFHAYIRQLNESRKHWAKRDWIEAVLWASYCYRQVNRVETFGQASFPNPTQKDLNVYLRKIERLSRDRSVFTAAHQTTCLPLYKSWLRQVLTDKILEAVARELCKAPDLQTCKKACMKLPGVGSFFAWQILCDLDESGCLAFQKDSFCELGPGAKQGLDLIFLKSKLSTPLQSAKKLVNLQSSVYRSLGIEFPYWDGRTLSLKEVEHSLCEYSKYRRIENGSKHMRKRITSRRPSSSEPVQCQQCEHTPTSSRCDTCWDVLCNECSPLAEATGWASICRKCRLFQQAKSNRESFP